VSLNRYAKRVDATQNDIVSGLRRSGVAVWIISQPCDTLTCWRGIWLPLECKPLKKRSRKDQADQTEFCNTFGVPIVRTYEEAYAAILAHEKRVRYSPTPCQKDVRESH